MTGHFTSSSPAADNLNLHEVRNLTAAGLAIVAATYGLARYCFGLFLPNIREEFHLDSETIGLIAGASYAGYLAATFLSSWLSTVVGPRLPILLGGATATLGMTIIALSPGPLVLALGVLVAGTSPGLAYPPYSDVIVRKIAPSQQNTAYSWINSGTGFGVALAGPLALFTGESWRLAWLAFAVIAALVTLWNLVVLPSSKPRTVREDKKALSFEIYLQPEPRRLFLAAFLFGVISAIYWTYAVDLLSRLNLDPRTPILFWFFLGAAGLIGCFAGGLVNRLSLRGSYFLLLIVVGVAITCLPLMADKLVAIYASAACFGVGFIVTTALFGIWSMQLFRDHPSIGFGATFFLISLGQGAGPVLGGYLIPVLGHAQLFLAAGLSCCALIFLSPRPGAQAS